MADVVLDASALLALLREEPGAARVAAALDGALICTVNLSEVVAKAIEKAGEKAGGPDEDAWRRVMALPIRTVDFDLALARRAAELRAPTRTAGLSFGDRACLALAERTGLPALTCDRRWADLGLGVEVVLVC